MLILNLFQPETYEIDTQICILTEIQLEIGSFKTCFWVLFSSLYRLKALKYRPLKIWQTKENMKSEFREKTLFREAQLFLISIDWTLCKIFQGVFEALLKKIMVLVRNEYFFQRNAHFHTGLGRARCQYLFQMKAGLISRRLSLFNAAGPRRQKL